VEVVYALPRNVEKYWKIIQDYERILIASRHQNLIRSSLGHAAPLQTISLKSVHGF